MLAGMVFGWATNTTFLSVDPPSTIQWGGIINMKASVASLNPGLLTITDGNLKFYFNGILMQAVSVAGEAILLLTALHYKCIFEYHI